jgi:F420-non-reducing hydrogenase iron-sulfur subunit
MGKFEPRIVSFCCNWYSYAGAPYPSGLKQIKVMCSGRVDPTFILRALKAGADGVLITACRPGDCHYMAGNFKTERMIKLTRKLLEQLGVEPERLMLEWVSTPEKVKDVAASFVTKLKKLGPLELGHYN